MGWEACNINVTTVDTDTGDHYILYRWGWGACNINGTIFDTDNGDISSSSFFAVVVGFLLLFFVLQVKIKTAANSPQFKS